MRCLVWDFDGTLGYREGGWSGAMRDALIGRGIDHVAARDIRPHILTGFRWHSPDREYSPAILADAWWDELIPLFARAFVSVCGLSEAEAQQIAREVRACYLRPESWRLFEDSAAALELLSSAGFRHALLSNHVPELAAILDLLKIRRHFDRVFNSAETGFEKPHPRAYAQVATALPSGADLVMIGDNPTADYVGAKAAGWRAVLVRRFTPGLTPYFSNLSDMANHLARPDA